MYTVRQLKLVSDFRCDAARCVQPCCDGYDVIRVDRKLVERYRQEAPELLKHVARREGRHAMILRRGQCSAREGILCGIQVRRGVHFLPEICHFYPRKVTRLGDELFITAHLPCDPMIRGAFFDRDAFDWQTVEVERLPARLVDRATDFPDRSPQDLFELHRWVMEMTYQPDLSSEDVVLKLLVLSHVLSGIEQPLWPDIRHGAFDLIESRIFENLRDEARKNPRPGLVRELVHVLDTSVATGSQPELVQILQAMGRLVEGESARRVHQTWLEACSQTPIDEIMKRYIRLRLSEHMFPVANWGDVMGDAVFLTTAYCALRLAFLAHTDSIDSFRAQDAVLRLVVRIERPFYTAPQPLYETFRDQGWMRLEKMVQLLVQG